MSTTEPAGTGNNVALRRPRGRPRDPLKRERIIAAAKHHFAESGFDKGSMERIAQAAGVSKVTLYNYFASKEALFNATVSGPVRQLMAREGDALTLDDPAQALLRIATAYLALVTSPETIEHVRLLHGRIPDQPALARSFFESGPQAAVDELVKYLKRARAHGSLAISNAPRAAEQFLSMVRGNEQTRLLLGLPPQRTGAARQQYCVDCVRVFLQRCEARPA